jgi:diguanylate cyclase (GGDEF)-like protein
MGQHVLPRQTPGSARAWAWAAVLATVVTAGFGAVLVVRPLTEYPLTFLDDLGQLGAATLGGAGAAVASARAYHARDRRLGLTWALIAAGVWAWALGQAIWSWYELMLERPVPFPSAADAGYLALPVLAGAGLLLWPAGRARRRDRLSALLDGVIIASALLLLSWSTSLGATWRAGGQDVVAAAIGAAYPIGDVVLASIVVLLLARSEPGNRAALLLLSGGVLALAIADSAFMYTTSTNSYASGALLDAGWFAGFLAVGVAGLAAQPTATQSSGTQGVPGWLRLLLPYVPALFATLDVFPRLFAGKTLHAVETGCALTVFLAGLFRQFLALADNRQLLATLRASENQLRHQAFHDPLTGLANRALFADRVDHALRLAARDGLPRAVVFVDLDDFKLINDGLGHAAGDRVLIDVATRLQACVRDSDTVARLGGDEFAVLLEGGHEPAEHIAQRIVEDLHAMVDIDGEPVPITASVGLATHRDRYLAQTPQELLAAADRAMYAAKQAGKDRWSSPLAHP